MNVDIRPKFDGAALDVAAIRAQFPILTQTVRGKPLVFLDSAASAQKPRAVISAMVQAMETQYANVHRGLHWMSERTTEAYEAARDAAQGLLNAADRSEIVFAGNTTGAINLLAHSYGRAMLKPGQAVLISGMEHHSNIVPWQMLRDAHGIELRVADITDAGELNMAAYEALLADGKVGLVAMTHMSNVLGTYTPAEQIVRTAHAHGAKVMLDGSQAVVHRRVDVQALDCDFYVFTGHKLYGPTGIGVLYGKRELLEAMPPFLGGGDMISSVTYERSTWAEVPHKFEAGTPQIIEGIGLKAAIDWVQAIGFDAIAAHESRLTEHALARLGGGGGRERDRPGAGPRRRGFLHSGQGARPRHRHPAGPAGHRGSRRAALRRAADAPAGPGQHGAGELRDLHHRGGDRSPGRHAGAGAGVLHLMFDDLRDLYQDVILQHGRKPVHMRRLKTFDATAKGDNPMCGDRVQVWVAYDPDGAIAETGFEARGCAISIASADLMVETVAGLRADAVRELFTGFERMARSGECPDCAPALEPAMERLKPLSGVHEYPSRVKCATLPWHALVAALDGEKEASSE